MSDPIRAARNARYYAAHKHQHRSRKQASKPFIGIDGEGGGTDELGRQNFLILRAGDNELFNNNNRLTTIECLEFILEQPANAILVGYYFAYDATQILRDLPTERLRRLFEVRDVREGVSPYTFWKGYAIDFRPRQYFRVARLDSDKLRVVPNTARTVNEVGGFFQKSFVEAIKEWSVGDKATVDMIAENKERREKFEIITQVERDYCAAECTMLAELMERLREVCRESDIEPNAWRGAGWLAARLHTKYRTPKRKEHEGRQKALEAMAIRAYYGGRFEVTTVGKIDGNVYEYDLNSAYPAAMLNVPCALHTRWKRFRGNAYPAGATYIAKVSFTHADGGLLCNIPIRRKGRLFWPRTGQGTYWGVELDAAIAAGTIVTEWDGGYYAETSCTCKSHAWVEELYTLRKSLGKSARGYPIKLGINGLYGKYAQRQGAAPWRDYIAAGIITAETRAKLIRAYAGNQDAILYLATDALFASRELHVDIGGSLGQWEHKIRDSLFIVQPGIYWSSEDGSVPKTRGIPRSKVIEARDEFEAVWKAWLADTQNQPPPNVIVPVKAFIGHRRALAWNRPSAAGSWITLGNGGRKISFDWKAKREADGYTTAGESIRTTPKAGGVLYVSEPYDPAQLTELDEQAMIDEAMEDFEPWGNSGE